MRTRKHVSDLSSREEERLAEAMRCLKKENIWDTYTDWHAEHGSHIHSTSAQFLPWHRIFILKFETALRNIDASVEMPYWDWTSLREIPPLFKQKLFGWMHVSRAIRHKPDELPTSRQVEAVLAQETFSGFSNALEELHNTVHNWVGGTMKKPKKSPNDPLFFLHHAYCDKLWVQWRTLHPGSDGSNDWDLHEPFEDFSYQEVIDNNALDYTYTDL